MMIDQISEQGLIWRKQGRPGPCEFEDALRCVVEQQEVSGKCISLFLTPYFSHLTSAIFLRSEVCGHQVGVGGVRKVSGQAMLQSVKCSRREKEQMWHLRPLPLSEVAAGTESEQTAGGAARIKSGENFFTFPLCW